MGDIFFTVDDRIKDELIELSNRLGVTQKHIFLYMFDELKKTLKNKSDEGLLDISTKILMIAVKERQEKRKSNINNTTSKWHKPKGINPSTNGNIK